MSTKENIVQFGLSDVHYAVSTYDPAQKIYTYGTVKDIPGAVNLNLPAKTAKYTKYADNMPFYNLIKNHGFDGSSEFVRIPNELLVDVFHDVIDATTGNRLVNANAKTEEFAMGFRIDGDPYNTKYWLYRCSAGRPAISGKTTEENLDIPNESMDITSMPRRNDGWVVRTAYEGDSNYDTFFDTVPEPPADDQESSDEQTGEQEETPAGQEETPAGQEETPTGQG